MTDKPILMSGPMVRAILEGRKHQTRRCGPAWVKRMADSFLVSLFTGDRLVVREAWRADSQVDGIKPSKLSRGEPILYEADGTVRTTGCVMIKPGRLRPGTHMPRWASRLTLHVTDVRVQRLQDISEGDVLAEGVFKWPVGFGIHEGPPEEHRTRSFHRASAAFRFLWDSLNGDKPSRAWRDNPWVVAVTFEPEHCNIDKARKP